jgi:hypothetical protein
VRFVLRGEVPVGRVPHAKLPGDTLKLQMLLGLLVVRVPQARLPGDTLKLQPLL